jgi:hypothetical protein
MFNENNAENYFSNAENKIYKTNGGFEMVIDNNISQVNKMDIQMSADLTSHSEKLFE